MLIRTENEVLQSYNRFVKIFDSAVNYGPDKHSVTYHFSHAEKLLIDEVRKQFHSNVLAAESCIRVLHRLRPDVWQLSKRTLEYYLEAKEMHGARSIPNMPTLWQEAQEQNNDQ